MLNVASQLEVVRKAYKLIERPEMKQRPLVYVLSKGVVPTQYMESIDLTSIFDWAFVDHDENTVVLSYDNYTQTGDEDGSTEYLVWGDSSKFDEAVDDDGMGIDSPDIRFYNEDSDGFYTDIFKPEKLIGLLD